MDEATSELLRQSLGLGSIPLIVIAVQQIKKAFPGWPAYAWPLTAIVIGVILNVMVAAAISTNIYVAVVLGVISAFLAMSAYDKSGVSTPPET